MKRIFLLAAIGFFIFTSCHPKSPRDKNPAPVSESKNGMTIKLSDLAIDKDLVCGMKIDGQGIADTTSYEGKIYGFCSPECKAEFLKNPKSYLSQQ